MYATQAEAAAAALQEVPKETIETIEIAIVEDKVTANERNPERPFFYCPQMAVKILHRFGTVVETITIEPSR